MALGILPCLYNYNNISKTAKEIIVVKNEIDCWILHQLGWENVVAIPPTEINAYKYLEPLKSTRCRINVIYSSKYADKILMKNTIDFMGKDRAYHIKLPYELSYIFLNNTEIEAKEIINTAINSAEESTLIDFVDIKTAFSEVLLELGQPRSDINLNEGIDSPWATVNTQLSFRWGNLVTIGGHAGHGKSTLALQWAIYLAKDLTIPTLFLCLEMNKMEHVYKLTELLLGEHKLGSLDYTMQADGILAQNERDVPLIISRGLQVRTADEIILLLEKAIIKYNLKVIIFDHFQLVTFSIEQSRNRSEASLYANFANSLKFLAERMNVVFICIAQLRKLDERAIPTKQDLLWSPKCDRDFNWILIFLNS